MEPATDLITEFAPTPKSPKFVTAVFIILVILLVGLAAYAYFGKSNDKAAPSDQVATSTPQTGYIIKKGNEIEPVLQQDIINAFLKQKTLFASGNIPEIRKYLVNGALPSDRERISKQLASTTDAALANYIIPFNTVMKIITVDMLKTPEATWIFSPDIDSVRIQRDIPPGNPDGIKNITIDLVKNNGVWY